jgi:hypothetical protein
MRVELAQLDTAATAADPDAGGPLTSGYDDDFGEVVVVPPVSGSARGDSARAETVVSLPAQIEPATAEELQMLATGRSPYSLLRLVFHYHDLESAGLVEAATGRPLLRVNDRLQAIRDYKTDALIEEFPNPPGLFATQVQSRSFGLASLKRNLLLVTFQSRQLSDRGAA